VTFAEAKMWNSAVLMTWGSFLVRSISLIVLLPLILTRLDPIDVAVWYLFATVITLQMLVDLGFTPTFTRIVAYGYTGLTCQQLAHVESMSKEERREEPNWDTVSQVYATMKVVYRLLSLLVLLLGATLGSWAVARLIGESASPSTAWFAWAVLLVTTVFSFYGNVYAALLQGLNKVALVQRWRMATGVASTLSAVAVLAVGGQLLELVIAQQLWIVVNIFVNRHLVNRVLDAEAESVAPSKLNADVWDVVWKPAWRSGLGVAANVGLIQLSGVFYSQVAAPNEVARYLIGLQLVRFLSNFSQVPFYSVLPRFAAMYASGNIDKLRADVQAAMLKVYWLFVCGLVVGDMFGSFFFDLIGSNIQFPEKEIWWLLGFGLLFERFGAMHLQVFSLSNKIVWHIANGMAGAVMLIVGIGLYPTVGVVAFPWAILIAYSCVYSPYCSTRSYRIFGTSCYVFERKIFAPPLIMGLLYVGGSFVV
jgi:hypothetical protein